MVFITITIIKTINTIFMYVMSIVSRTNITFAINIQAIKGIWGAKFSEFSIFYPKFVGQSLNIWTVPLLIDYVCNGMTC